MNKERLTEQEVKEVVSTLKHFGAGKEVITVQNNQISGYEDYIGNFTIRLVKEKDNLFHFHLCNDKVHYSFIDLEDILSTIDYIYGKRRLYAVQKDIAEQELRAMEGEEEDVLVMDIEELLSL